MRDTVAVGTETVLSLFCPFPVLPFPCFALSLFNERAIGNRRDAISLPS
jgi:hypothetical protein